MSEETVGLRTDTERATGVAREVSNPLVACDFPLLVWNLPTGKVQLGNQPAAELFGLRLDGLVGYAATDLLSPADAVGQTIKMVGAGVVDNVSAKRWAHPPGGPLQQVRVWTRAIEVDGSRAAVSLIIPVKDIGQLGRDPAAAWRDLTSVAVGVADFQMRITAVSSDIHDVLGFDQRHFVGRSLNDMVSVDGILAASKSPHATLVGHWRSRAERADGTLSDVCLLVATFVKGNRLFVAFALIAAPAPAPDSERQRIHELEQRLRVIGAEVRAGGVLDDIPNLLSVSDHPELRTLTTRQWEVVNRLVRGDRVQIIAAALYLSPSTVRNHLAAIFQKFGVHSQAELIAVLNRRG